MEKYEGVYSNLYRLTQDMICINSNGFWGILDNYGSILIETKYDSILEVRGNYLTVLFYGETGVLDGSGKWIILPRNANIEILSDTEYLISSVYGSAINEFNGDTLFSTDNILRQHHNVFIEENWDGLMGLVNSSYESILPVEKDFTRCLIKDSAYLFHDSEGWGLVLENGSILFEKDDRFQEILSFSEGFIGVKIDGKFGFVDLKGRLRISNQYEEIGPLQNNHAPVKIMDKWGSVDRYERIQIQPYFDEIFTFKNDVAIVRRDNRYGLINSSDHQIIDTEYDSIYRTSHDTFILKFGDKYGLADIYGRIKLFPKFESLSDLGNGYIIAQRKDKKGLISANGVTIIPQVFDEIVFDQYSENYICGKKSSWTTYYPNDISKMQ
jgi:hypothetical protein